jgi:hypothetical protein
VSFTALFASSVEFELLSCALSALLSPHPANIVAVIAAHKNAATSFFFMFKSSFFIVRSNGLTTVWIIA